MSASVRSASEVRGSVSEKKCWVREGDDGEESRERNDGGGDDGMDA